MSITPPSILAASPSPVVSQGLAETQNINGANGISDAVQSFTEVLSEQTAAAHYGTIHDRTPLQDEKHSSNKGGRQSATSGKAKDGKRSGQELPLAVPAVLSVEVPPKGTILVAIPADRGKGEAQLARVAGSSKPDAIPAHSQVKADPTSSQLHGPYVSSVGDGIAKVAGPTVDTKSQKVGNSKSTLETPNHPVTTAGLETPNHPVTTAGLETPKVSSSQEGSIISEKAATPSVAAAAKSAVVSVSAVPLSGDSISTPNGLKISADLFQIRGESPLVQARAKVRLVSGGLVDVKPVSAGLARTASSDRVLSSADASSGIGAAATLNSVQTQKVMASTMASSGYISGNGSTVLDVKALSQAISHPLIDGHGTQTVVVAMDPTYLGHLEAVVSIDHAGLQVSITPQTQVGHNALANSIEALKNHLSQGGVNVNVTLHDFGSQSGNEPRYLPGQSHGESEVPADTAGAPSSDSVSTFVSGQIHLVL